MKKAIESKLENVLNLYGMLLDAKYQDDSNVWFHSEHLVEGLTTYLRFTYKNNLKIVVVKIGWKHDLAHYFAIEALKADWSKGYKWLEEAGVTDNPCFCLFNLGAYMEWPLAGISTDDYDGGFEKELIRLCEVIKGKNWLNIDEKALFEIYMEDVTPFRWTSCNSALRIAEIAGLIRSFKSNKNIFLKNIESHLKLIESDMFGLGNAPDWIGSLEKRIISGV